MYRTRALAFTGLALAYLSLTLLAPAASARAVYYAVVCDASFNSIAVSKGYPACSDMIREEFVKKGIQFINDTTSADTGGVTYYLSGSWSSPAAGSDSSVFLESLDNYSAFEEQSPWHFKIGFTGKRMAIVSGASNTKWRGASRAQVAVVSYKEASGADNIVWPSTALHEVTHLLRDDGFHHSDDQSTFRTCVMDRLDYSSHTGIILHEVCSYCRGQINRMTAGWTSLTNLGGPASLGIGSRDTSAGPAQAWRWSERYWGLRDIDAIRTEADASGTLHNYVIGYHALDAAEYRMMLGQSGSNNDLGIIGKADRPGPVTLNVFSDGHYDQTYTLDADNNVNQTKWKIIHNWGAVGAHQIGIEFVHDAYNGGGADGDRNLFLDGLGVW